MVFDATLAPAGYGGDELTLRSSARSGEELEPLDRRTSAMREPSSTPYARRVRELLMQQGTLRGSEMQIVAHAFGLSARTLRRRLAAEDSSYRAVVNEALATVAKHLIRDKGRTIAETAYEMGFADPSSFHRAFKRWTGGTPRRYALVASAISATTSA